MRRVWWGILAAVLATSIAAAEPAPGSATRRAPAPLPADDLTFRPTVLIRKGTAQGSGTVIASDERRTLVLTAAHVVKGSGPLIVELHRYNFGLGRAQAPAHWPREVPARLVAADLAADVAVIEIPRIGPLPYIARLASPNAMARRGTVVTSVGIDKGTRLSSWRTRVSEVAWFEMNDKGEERPFVVTVRPPEHGRSGGGLFLDDGSLVGLCIGRAEMVKGRRSGIFASGASIRRLLADHDLDEAILRSRDPAGRRSPVTTTNSR